MSNIIDIEALRKEFKEKSKVKDLKDFAESQQRAIEQLLNQNKLLESKVKHLEVLLTTSIRMQVTQEEQICMEQIVMLKALSSARALTLEETKRLDLLVKSLVLIRDKTPASNKNESTDIEENDLVAIAREETKP